MHEDFCGKEGIVFIKVAIIEDKQELDTIIQSLNRVGNATSKLKVSNES